MNKELEKNNNIEKNRLKIKEIKKLKNKEKSYKVAAASMSLLTIGSFVGSVLIFVERIKGKVAFSDSELLDLFAGCICIILGLVSIAITKEINENIRETKNDIKYLEERIKGSK